MPKATKTENNEPTKRDDEWYNARIMDVQTAINNMDEGRDRNIMQYALDDVNNSDLNDSDRYFAFRHLKKKDAEFKVNSVANVRSSDGNKAAYERMTQEKANELLNNLDNDALYSSFARSRVTEKMDNKNLTKALLVEWLAGRYEANNPYDKKINYNATTEQTTEQTTEEETV